MALNATLKNFEIEENKTIEDASHVLKSGLVNFLSAMNEKRNYAKDYESMLNLTEASIKKYAASTNKYSEYLEPNEIEQIKKALVEFSNNNEKTSEFKKEIIEDLASFQQQILTTHKKRIAELTKEKEICEKQLRIAECEKNKLIMERLSQIVWPYDAKTKEYDQKIAQLQAKVELYTTKIKNQKDMRPAANEKDILLYTMHLREKFAAR